MTDAQLEARVNMLEQKHRSLMKELNKREMPHVALKKGHHQVAAIPHAVKQQKKRSIRQAQHKQAQDLPLDEPEHIPAPPSHAPPAPTLRR